MVITAYQMTQLILEALSIDDPKSTPWEITFKMTGYGGSMIDLFAIVEHICLERNIIDLKKYKNDKDEICDNRIPKSAWGTGWYNLERYTSFNDKEINLFLERFHYLLNQQIISPGWIRNSVSLPYFHVTEYGLMCIESRDILPYDVDGYLKRIMDCSNHTDWDKYYIWQCLKCFNSGIYDAATIMLGIESEYLARRLINDYKEFLVKEEPSIASTFEKKLEKCGGKISKEYEAYSESWRSVSNEKDQQSKLKYEKLSQCKIKLDSSADQSFLNYLRLTRNELAHPSNTVMEPSETMLMLVSFLKYFEIQNMFLDIYNS